MVLAKFQNRLILELMCLPTIHRFCLKGLWIVTLIFAVVSVQAASSPEELLLKDYRPRSIYKIPETRVEKARYPTIDVHSHDYGRSDADLKRWVETMDAVGIERTIILSGATGRKFDEMFARYGKYPGRFEVWCGIDYTGFQDPGFGPAATAELERCFRAEVAIKGLGVRETWAGDVDKHIRISRPERGLRSYAEAKRAGLR